MQRILFTVGSLLILASLILGTLVPGQTASALEPGFMEPDGGTPSIIFVARAHLATPDDIFEDDLGPAGQFGTGLPKYAPGSKLVRRDPDGSLYVYNTPGLVDIQAPDVNFDGTKIVFSGATTLIPGTTNSGWRLYEINVDGSDFHQLTFSDRDITIPNANLWGNQETYGTYNDWFPAYLADGRIAFVSTRYPTRSHYDNRASTNLYLINGDGSNLHRVTTERAGLLHPTPLPDGRILLTRWWNQFNQPTNQGIYNREDNRDYDQYLADGTIIFANPDATFNPANGLLPGGQEIRDAPNTWHLMTVNPDGTGFKRYAWTPAFTWARDNDSGHDTYQGAQPAVILNNGQMFVAFTSQADGSMVHSTQHTGIRVARPGLEMLYANAFDALAGQTIEQYWNDEDTTVYALHPWGMPDGTILYSQSSEDKLPATGQYTEGAHIFDLQGSNLRYQLYTMNLDGTNKTLLPVDLSSIGLDTADVMDAKPIVARVGWTALPDEFTSTPSDDPISGNVPNSLAEYWFSTNGPDDIETATIHNPNVYANASLYAPYVNNSPPPGSVAFVQLWIDANQFTGAYCYDDWPDPCADFEWDNQVRAVLWDEVPVSLTGEFTMTIPADVMGFFVLRDVEHNAIRGWNRGYISIAQGSAWARPGETVTCVGCHMGHVSGSVEDVLDEAEQGWTNVAPYAVASASSYHFNDGDPDYQPFTPSHLNDRHGWVPLPEGGPVLDPEEPYMDDETGWLAAEDQGVGEWVELAWPTDMLVKSIRLVGPPPNGGDWGGFGDPAQFGDYYVEGGTLTLYRDGSEVDSLSIARVEPLENGGTLIVLDEPVVIDQLRFTIDALSGSWYWQEIAALNEIEVIGQAAESWPLFEVLQVFLPLVKR